MIKRNNKGITLIALVITIIVLLILAGVTLGLTLGENGLLKRAEGAKGEYTKSEIKEELEMDITDLYIEKKQKGETLTKQDIADKIGDKTIILDVSDDKIEGEYKDYGFTVDENNKVIVGSPLTGAKPVAEITILDTESNIESARMQVIASIEEGEIVSIEPINGAVLKTENSVSDKIFEVTENKKYRFKITGSNGRMAIVTSAEVNNLVQTIEAESILSGINKVTSKGLKKVKVKTNETEEVIYSMNVVRHEGNMVLDGITECEGAILVDKEYSFGKAEDVATQSEYAKNTVVLKVEGNLTIEENVKLTAVKSENGHGGPKGLIVYCTGELINKGNISMTARGAKAEGQDVYLWKNIDGTYEYIPAIGANGGAEYNTGAKEVAVQGKTGENGQNRQTGGGGSGGARHGDESGYAHAFSGGKGTSYSGGVGSGAINENSAVGPTNGVAAPNDGGTGGAGRVYRGASSWAPRASGGGTGNPGGNGATHTSGALSNIGNVEKYKGNDGTGGLLVIFANKYNNQGTIDANGMESSTSEETLIMGGASGGGSINIFYNEFVSNNVCIANGGAGVNYGGTGGNGCISMGTVVSGTYVEK